MQTLYSDSFKCFNWMPTATFKWWRRGELNPRPRNLATRSLHAYPVPLVSLLALRTGKTR